MTTDSTSPAPARLTRTAWLILAVGWLIGGAMIGGVYFPNAPLNIDESDVLVRMGSVIGAVMSVWAILLAVRAIRKDEPVELPLLLMITIAGAASMPFLWFWYTLPEYSKSEFHQH